MKIHYFAGLSAAVCLSLLNSQSGLAFSIIPPQPGATFRYQPEATYFFRGSEWKTEISSIDIDYS